jgi:hypothetical protein
MKAAERRRSSGGVARRSRIEERKLDALIDELCGCLTEGDALAELEREHRAEVVADEHRRA